MLPRTGSSSWSKIMNFKTGFRVSPIYPNSIFQYDIDKLADWWSNLKPKSRIIQNDNLAEHCPDMLKQMMNDYQKNAESRILSSH